MQGPVKPQDVKINQIIVPNFISSYKTKDKDGKVKEEKTKLTIYEKLNIRADQLVTFKKNA